jgi:rhodanese-related sulfurtransferase
MSFYYYSGIGAFLYTIYAGMKYYALSGEGLVEAHKVKSMNIDHIIDVRTKMEWNMGHYKDAKHIPAQNINETILKKLKISKNDKILVYCNTGQRARKAAEIIRNLGYKNVYYIETSWKTL